MKTVILCGGSGTRLWPISRKKSPKQFAKIFSGASLFEKTVERNKDLAQEFIVVVNQAQLELCKTQINSKATFLLLLLLSGGAIFSRTCVIFSISFPVSKKWL